MTLQIKKLSAFVLIAGLTLSLSSCFIIRPDGSRPQKKSATTSQPKQKKAHPHGGPPGQTKKAKGHPGKRH